MSNTHLFLDGGNIDWHDIKKLTFANREAKYENVYQRIEGKGIRLGFGAELKKSNKKKGQNYSGNFWFLDGEFYYEKIYYVDGMNSDNIRSKIEKKFNSLTFNSENWRRGLPGGVRVLPVEARCAWDLPMGSGA